MTFGRFPVLRKVLVTTKTDRTVKGVVWRRRGGYLVLRQAEYLGPGPKVKMDGELLIPVDNVDLLQVVD